MTRWPLKSSSETGLPSWSGRTNGGAWAPASRFGIVILFQGIGTYVRVRSHSVVVSIDRLAACGSRRSVCNGLQWQPDGRDDPRPADLCPLSDLRRMTYLHAPDAGLVRRVGRPGDAE